MRILLVEDDEITALSLVETLRAHQYIVNLARDGETGLTVAQASDYNLILLDVMLPKLDGITVCQQLREQGYNGSILLLTAKDGMNDRVLGLDAGADDYVVKPFDLPELLARIRALLRRSQESTASVITWENLRFDSTTSKVTHNGKTLHLTPKEFCVLELFLCNPKRIFSRSAILDRLWDFAESPGEETVSSHIYSLRQKLKAAGSIDPIETVHGLGYRLRALASEPSEPIQEASPPPAISPLPEPKSPRQQQAQERLTRSWEKFKPKLADQMMQLEAHLQAILAENQSTENQKIAEQIAHKLVGAVGLFGWQTGADFLRQLENQLQTDNLPPSQLETAIQQIQQLHQKMLTSQTLEQLQPFQEHYHPQSPNPLPLSVPDLPAYSLQEPPLILIVDDDLLLSEQIRMEATILGWRVEVAIDLTVARAMIRKSPPNAIVLDLNFPASQEDGLALLRELTIKLPQIPVLVFTARESLPDRIEVVRLGACAFLHKPIAIPKILQTIADVLNQTHRLHPNRVMAVNHDRSSLSNMTQWLQSRNIEVTPLETTQQFWEVLTTVSPDLLILDWDLPTFSGVELCQVVRHDPQWQTLPILVVTEHTDRNSIQQVFAAGANDFIPKPMVEADLVTRIISRLEGMRTTRS
ncbi:response regulator [Alkalinema sp. FACHB-956]|uniref:response regulator n=1 Tax=Alkalinema sp. FACHB-956 TaxID=2692768 RepID=UPI001688EBEF|nr:response regulator [Alkalinema sp. FACHB-956]MBD2327859.1 response regulator [Alkalinema sp. FACHB-956]